MSGREVPGMPGEGMGQMPAAVETMMYAREVPWHGLGTKVDGLQTAEEALEKAGLNWTVLQAPLSYDLPDGGQA